ARSVIKVAESAILNEDPAITDADVAARVEAAYNDRYVEAYKAANDGNYPTVTATVTVKKDISSDSGYVTDETLSYEGTVEYKGIGEKATGKEYAIDVTDYAYAVGLDEEKVVTLDGAEFTLNYNYVANRAQIIGFDTEEEKDIHNAESANLTTYQETVVNSVDPFARDGGVTNLSIAEGIAYEGTNSLMVDMGDSWDGPAWKNGFALPFKTNTLEFYAYSPIATTRALYLILPNYTTHGQDQLMYKEYASTSDIVLTGGKWEKVTLTFPVEFNVINCFEIKVSTDTRIYIDSIYAVKDYYVDENTLAPETYLDDFSFTPELKSTVYFPDELAEKSLTVSARTVNGEETGEWGALTPAAGEYTVETSDEINVYELKYELDGNLLRGDFARRGITWANFDEEDPHYTDASQGYSGAFKQSQSIITSRLNINRGRSMEFRQSYTYITHYVNNAGTLMDLGFTAKKVGMYVYFPWGYAKSGGGNKYLNAYTPKNLEFWSPNPVNAYYATRYFTPDIETETNKVLYIEVEIGKDITQFMALGIGGTNDYCIFIDSIMLLA
ncbi:MAG TPA: hypothetical protein DDW54_03495, partial [Clostridiales bacterium]|nr:hypothetical protein [Clostridiales bacterium]